MKPSDARLAIIEDSSIGQLMIGKFVQQMGAEAVAVARNPEEAKEVVGKLGEIGANVVLLDCNLGEGGHNLGFELARQIRDQYPEIPIASISSDPYFAEQTGIYPLENCGLDSDELMAYIQSLPEDK